MQIQFTLLTVFLASSAAAAVLSLSVLLSYHVGWYDFQKRKMYANIKPTDAIAGSLMFGTAVTLLYMTGLHGLF